jgi:hypothetical protein
MSKQPLDIDARGGSIDLDALDADVFPFDGFEVSVGLEKGLPVAQAYLKLLSSWQFRLGRAPVVDGLVVYANNAAAVAGGLAVGELYRNGANPDVVCVVH